MADILTKGNATDNWYIADGKWRRPVLDIPGGQTRQQQVNQMVLAGHIPNTVPKVIDQDTLNAMRPV